MDAAAVGSSIRGGGVRHMGALRRWGPAYGERLKYEGGDTIWGAITL